MNVGPSPHGEQRSVRQRHVQRECLPFASLGGFQVSVPYPYISVHNLYQCVNLSGKSIRTINVPIHWRQLRLDVPRSPAASSAEGHHGETVFAGKGPRAARPRRGWLTQLLSRHRETMMKPCSGTCIILV